MDSSADQKLYDTFCLLSFEKRLEIIRYGLSCIDQNVNEIIQPNFSNIRPNVSSYKKGLDAEVSVKDAITRYSVISCRTNRYSTDLVVTHLGKVVYVEVKDKLVTTNEDVNKFYRDLSSQSDVFGGLMIGWKINKFECYKGIPVMFLTDSSLINEALDILFSFEPRKNTDKLIQSAGDIIKIINNFDVLKKAFTKFEREMLQSINVFKERCESVDINIFATSDNVLKLIIGKHAYNNITVKGLIDKLVNDHSIISGKTIITTYNDKKVVINILVTKTRVNIINDGVTLSIEVDDSNISKVMKLLE